MLDSQVKISFFTTVCLLFPTWDPPSGWTGPAPVFYMSFNCLDGLHVREGSGSVEVDATVVSGKVIYFDCKKFKIICTCWSSHLMVA